MGGRDVSEHALIVQITTNALSEAFVPGSLTKTEEFDLWLEGETVALRLQRSLPYGTLRILKRREKDDSPPAIISPRILKRRGTPPSEPSAKLTRPHNWDRHARHPRRCGLELGLTLRLPSRRRRDNASSTHLTIGNRANRRLLRARIVQ